MEPGALAPEDQIEAAIEWLQKHPSIHKVLLTGGGGSCYG